MDTQELRARDRQRLDELLAQDPTARARFDKLADFKQEMCFDWIAGAPTPALREQRVHRLARWVGLIPFDPFYSLSGPAFSELDDLYGPPVPLHTLPPDERRQALEEKRVLGAYHYRNFDDGGTTFYIVAPDYKVLDDVLVVYSRPCVLTRDLLRWLNYNNLETMQEVRDWFGLE